MAEPQVSKEKPKSEKYYVTAFYQFLDLSLPNLKNQKNSAWLRDLSATDPKTSPLDHLSGLKEFLVKNAEHLEIKGLVILGCEGINSTLAAPSLEALDAYKLLLCECLQVSSMNFKDSQSGTPPFRRFVVKLREEIVTLGTPELVPQNDKNHHLSPREWNQVLENETDYVLIDTRNWYEYNIGTFAGALNPNIEKFTDFPDYLEQQQIAKDKKILIFCTGGIRCEKGILELQRQGFQNVFQLEGGILKYLEEYPNNQFQGECFVFDHRVALNQQLQPSTTYGLCPHCGQPSDIQMTCQRCDSTTLICGDCSNKEVKKVTCSKNCAHHFQLHPERKAPHQKR